MSRFDSLVSAEAWERLVRDYEEILGEIGSPTDVELANLLRETIYEVEGIE